MQYTIKHLRLGEIVDQAIAIVRNRFVTLFSILLIALIPVAIIQGLVFQSIAPVVPPGTPPPEVWRFYVAWFLQYWPLMLGMFLLGFLVTNPISSAAVVEAVGAEYLGKPISTMEALRLAIRKWPRYVWTNILAAVCYVVAYLCCLLPVVLPIFFFALWQSVVIFENLSGISALKRSTKLIAPNWLMRLVLGIVIFAIQFLLGLSANFIPEVHLRVVASVLLQSGMMLISSAAYVVFYFSCRSGLENFDLHHLAESIGAELEEIPTGDLS
jgi:hypothetical protein